MKQVSGALRALLEGDAFLMADLFTVSLAQGQVLYYTNADKPVEWQGRRFEMLLVKRGSVKTARGLSVDGNELEVSADASSLLQGLPWVEAALGGALDGARVKMERLFFRDWDTPVEAVVLFSGRVSGVSGSRYRAKVSVKSDIELLNVSSPRNIYQAGCMRTVYDKGCKANKTRLTVSGRVAVRGSETEIVTSLTNPDGWFDLGVLEFTTGRNRGLTRSVKSYAKGRFEFALRLPFVPEPGDAFRVYPGCNKSKKQCEEKFNNVVHFRGFPFIPAASTVM